MWSGLSLSTALGVHGAPQGGGTGDAGPARALDIHVAVADVDHLPSAHREAVHHPDQSRRVRLVTPASIQEHNAIEQVADPVDFSSASPYTCRLSDRRPRR